MRSDILAAIQAAIEARSFGTASAAKRGRNPAFPYVPVIDHSDANRTRTEQILGKAFAERNEAIAYAAATIEARKRSDAERLADPRHRALRVSYGLPQEIEAHAI